MDIAQLPTCQGLDPQIAITAVAILGALSHLIQTVLRAWQDYRHSLIVATAIVPGQDDSTPLGV